MAELEEFFNRCSEEEDQGSDEEFNEFNCILERRSQIKLFTKDGKRRKRFRELDTVNSNSLNKCSNNKIKQKPTKPKINFENYSITHVIGKGASAVVKLGTHNIK